VRLSAILWPAKCNQMGVRVMLKTVCAGSASQAASAKVSSGTSFLDLLRRTSDDADQASGSTRSGAGSESNDPADQSGSNQPSPASRQAADCGGAKTASTFAPLLAAGANPAQNDRQAGASVPLSQATPRSRKSADPQTEEATERRGEDNKDDAAQCAAQPPAFAQAADLSLLPDPSAFAGQHVNVAADSVQNLTATSAATVTGKSGAAAIPAQADPPASSQSTALQNQVIATETVQAMGAEWLQISAPPVAGDSASSGTRASTYQTTGATFSISDAGGKTAEATNAQAISTPKGTGAAQHSDAAAAQAGQHPQNGSSQTVAPAFKPADSGNAQPVAFAAHVAPGQDGPAHAGPGGSDATALHRTASQDLPSDQLDGAAVAAPGINTARLIQSMSETEMRLGMHSSEFGDIAIRTSVSLQQVQAQISVDHGELGSAIAAHLPALESKLGNDFGLHASIDVNQTGGSLSNGHGQPSQHGGRMPSGAGSAESGAQTADADASMISAAAASADDARLDIRA